MAEPSTGIAEHMRDALRRPVAQYFFAAAAALVALEWRLLMVKYLGHELPTYITFYPAVMLVAVLAGFWPGLVVTALSALFVAYWVLPPAGFPVEATSDIVGLALFTAMGIFMSVVAEGYRRTRDKAAAYEQKLALRETHEALRRTEERWAITLRSIGDAVLTTDAQGQVAFLNPVAETLTGWTTNQAVGQPIQRVFRIVREDTGEPASDIVQQVLQHGRTVSLANHTALVTKAGDTIPIEDSAAPIRDAQGKVIGVVLVFHDVSERRQTLEALRRSEERLRISTMAAEIGVWYWTPGTAYVEVSANWRRLFGVAPEVEVTFDTWRAALHPEDRDRAVGELNAASDEHREFDVEYRALRPDGSIRWLVDRGRAWYDENGRSVGMAGVNVDITERKLAEQALAASEQQVRAKLDSILSPEGDLGDLDLADIIDAPALQSMMEEFHKFARIPMAIIDMTGNVLVGVGWQDICTKFHRVHPESCKHCIESDVELSAGVDAGEFKLYHCKNNMWDVATPIVVGGKHVGNVFTGQFFFHGETPDLEIFRAQARQYGFNEQNYLAALDRVTRLTREQLAAVMTYFMQLADMISKLSYSNLKLARSLGERDVLTHSLRTNEARLRLALDAANSGAWEWDLENHTSLWDDEACSLFGLDRNTCQPLHEDWLATVHPDDRERARQAAEKAAREGTDLNLEYRVQSDGGVRWLLVRGRPVPDATGRPKRMVGIVMDTTDRKRAEAALIRSEKLASVGRMAATVAHEINNPLAAVMNAVFLAKNTPDMPDHVGQYLDIAETELQRIADLTRQSLGFYRESSLPAATRIEEVVGSAITVLEPKRRAKRVKIDIERHGDTNITGVAGELRQVVTNLLANSLDAVTHGGVIKVRLSRFSHNGGPVKVRVTVADNGVGVPPSALPRLFEPFFTTKDKSGTGLGLWVSKEIIEKHGGSIRVHSQTSGARKGTTFSIVLPIDAALASPQMKAASASTS